MGFMRLFAKAGMKKDSHALCIGDLSQLQLHDTTSVESPRSTFQDKVRKSRNSRTFDRSSSAKHVKKLVHWMKAHSSTLETQDKAALMQRSLMIKEQLEQSLMEELHFQRLDFLAEEHELSKENCLAKIKALFKDSNTSTIMILFIGEVDECGNWKFGSNKSSGDSLDNLITFRELTVLWQKYRRHSQHLFLMLDCPNSGKWVKALKALSRAEQIALSMVIQASDSGDDFLEEGDRPSPRKHTPGTFTPCYLQNNLRVQGSAAASWPVDITPSFFCTWLGSSLTEFGLPVFFFNTHVDTKNPSAMPPQLLKRYSIQERGQDHSSTSSPQLQGEMHRPRPQSCNVKEEVEDEEPELPAEVTESGYLSDAQLPRKQSMPIHQHADSELTFKTVEPSHKDSSRQSFDSKLYKLLLEEKKRRQRMSRAMDGDEQLDEILNKPDEEDSLLSLDTMTDLLRTRTSKEYRSSSTKQSVMHVIQMDNSTPQAMTNAPDAPWSSPHPFSVDITKEKFKQDPANMLPQEKSRMRHLSDSKTQQADNMDKIQRKKSWLSAMEQQFEPRTSISSRVQGDDLTMCSLASSSYPVDSPSRGTPTAASGINSMLRYLMRGPAPGALDSDPPSPAAGVLVAGRRGGRGRLEIGGSETSSMLFNDDTEHYRMLKELKELEDMSPC